MDYFGYAYFVERPRRIEDLMVPHLIEQERPYRIAIGGGRRPLMR